MTEAGTIRKDSLKEEESFKNLIGRSRRKDISSEGIRERTRRERHGFHFLQMSFTEISQYIKRQASKQQYP